MRIRQNNQFASKYCIYQRILICLKENVQFEGTLTPFCHCSRTLSRPQYLIGLHEKTRPITLRFIKGEIYKPKAEGNNRKQLQNQIPGHLGPKPTRPVTSRNPVKISLTWTWPRSSGRGLRMTGTDPFLCDICFHFLDISHIILVIHSKLILKLHSYGIRSTTLRWIQAFLSNRRQRVAIEGEESDTVPVPSGVPQGSVLGPILFLAYINGLPQDIVSKSE